MLISIAPMFSNPMVSDTASVSDEIISANVPSTPEMVAFRARFFESDFPRHSAHFYVGLTQAYHRQELVKVNWTIRTFPWMPIRTVRICSKLWKSILIWNTLAICKEDLRKWFQVWYRLMTSYKNLIFQFITLPVDICYDYLIPLWPSTPVELSMEERTSIKSDIGRCINVLFQVFACLLGEKCRLNISKRVRI